MSTVRAVSVARVASIASILMLALTACATTRTGSGPGRDGRLNVVAAENIWGDLAAAVGGTQVSVRGIIDSPNADPHDYEPTAADGVAVGEADLVIVNGLGYDTWASKLIAANKLAGKHVLDVGDVTGHRIGDNPHRWYGGPAEIGTVLDAVVSRLSALDPLHAADFQSNETAFQSGSLARYSSAITQIRSHYIGTPIGASESIIVPLAAVLGLDLRTPAAFLDAVSEGVEPTIRDKNLCDQQIRNHEIKVYVYNSQNATPDVQAQVRLARSESIPVVTVSETPTPQGASFVDWQVAQLNALAQALEQAR